MPTSRPFAYNTGTTISGTEQVGDLSVGFPTDGFESTGLQWWNGPDEDLGYVVAHTTPEGNQPNPLSVPAYLGFWRSTFKTEESFITLAEYVSNLINNSQNFTGGTQAADWLTLNGYWTSWAPQGITFSQTFISGQAPSASVENAWTTFRSQLTGSYNTMTISNDLGVSVTVTDPLVQSIATALYTATTNTNFSVVIGSRTWRVIQGCVSGTATETSIYLTSSGVCDCGGAGTYTVRPMIKNMNWGGLNGSSCNSPTQTITVTFS